MHASLSHLVEVLSKVIHQTYQRRHERAVFEFQQIFDTEQLSFSVWIVCNASEDLRLILSVYVMAKCLFCQLNLVHLSGINQLFYCSASN